MSRNVRQKYPRTPTKVAKRRDSVTSSSSLSLDEDDENGYSGVEDVSDSNDDDEEHVYAAEEAHILEQAPRPLVPADEDDDDDDEVEDDDDDGTADDAESWNGLPTDPESDNLDHFHNHIFENEDDLNYERHVRFALPVESDSDDTTSETGLFPDLFVAQSDIDPSFRRKIEHLNNYDSSQAGLWDWHSDSHDMFPSSDNDVEAAEESDTTPWATPVASRTSTRPPSPAPSYRTSMPDLLDLDGYESDGETTEDDEPERPMPVLRKPMRRSSPAEPSSESDTAQRTPFRPRVSRFDSSEGKPMAMFDPTTNKMVIFTPQRRRPVAVSPGQHNMDFSGQALAAFSPMTPGADIAMLGTLFGLNPPNDMVNMQPFSSPFAAAGTLYSDAAFLDSDDSEFLAAEYGEDEDESMLNVEDFITFHNDSSDEEDEGESPADYGDLFSSPSRAQTPATTGTGAADASSQLGNPHPLLTHFDNNSNVVGAFRQDQINRRLISSEIATQESLSFSRPFHHGTLRGIKKDRMATVTTTITQAPHRKRSNTAMMQGVDLQGSPRQKRKASEAPSDHQHKKQRSISEVGGLII